MHIEECSYYPLVEIIHVDYKNLLHLSDETGYSGSRLVLVEILTIVMTDWTRDQGQQKIFSETGTDRDRNRD